MNAIRANARDAAELGTDDGEEVLLGLEDRSESPYSAAERESVAKTVRTILADALDETERIVFTLHYGEDVPLDTITSMLRLQNQSGAKAYIVSAKRKLARFAQQWKVRGQFVKDLQS